jgi:hypothetical protein
VATNSGNPDAQVHVVESESDSGSHQHGEVEQDQILRDHEGSPATSEGKEDEEDGEDEEEEIDAAGKSRGEEDAYDDALFGAQPEPATRVEANVFDDALAERDGRVEGEDQAMVDEEQSRAQGVSGATEQAQ